MPQKLFYSTTVAAAAPTTTTSFIVSSDESLNRRPLSSSGRSSDTGSSSSSSGVSSSSGGCGDNMAATAAASDLIQNTHHQHQRPYFAATVHNHHLAFNQSSESSSSQYSSSSGAGNANKNPIQVTPTEQQMNVITTPTTFTQQQAPNQRFGSAPDQLSVSSLNEQYGPNPHHFTDMQRQLTTTTTTSNNTNQQLGLSSSGSQGQQQQYLSYANNQKSNPVISSSSFQQQQQHSPNQRSSLNSLDSSSTANSLMPINVKGMLLNGFASDEVLRSWLMSIKCDEYLRNFLDHGYDMHLLTRMTPQDLTAIGVRSPNLRKKLLLEIKKLNLEVDEQQQNTFGDSNGLCPNDLAQWLTQLRLSEYYGQLCREGYDTIDRVCELTWEDLEEIGIAKLGHQKQLLLGIERVQKLEKQNDNAIYDVHPNHRISLHPGMSDKRLSRSTVRSGFFTTKSGNLDRNRGVPVVPVTPALKHVTSSLANLDLSKQQQQQHHQAITTNIECLNGNNQKIYSMDGGDKQRSSPQSASHWSSQQQGNEQQQQTMKMSEFTGTMKRPPPLPPVRTNSLKITPDQVADHNNAIYDNTCGSAHANQPQAANGLTIAPATGYNPASLQTPTSSTSFLRTPKLGTLTATTNKMLSHGGHIQTISTQAAHVMLKSVPIREAPHPPQMPPPPPPPTAAALPVGSQTASIDPLVDSSLIGHQIASADEFPPPPPPPQ